MLVTGYERDKAGEVISVIGPTSVGGVGPVEDITSPALCLSGLQEAIRLVLRNLFFLLQVLRQMTAREQGNHRP